MGQIQLPQASMPLMTPFHHSQFHCPILVEVGQLIPDTFANVSKNHRMKYDTQTKMVSFDSAHTRQNFHGSPNCDLCDLRPQLTFD